MAREKAGRLSDLYLFALSSKNTAGVYFLAFVFLYMLFGKIGVAQEVSLGFWTALQMALACMLVGLGQGMIVPIEKINLARSAIWMIWSSAIVVGFVLGFGWFQGFPLWCGIVFCVFLIAGFAALLFGFLLKVRRENKRLNERLKAYQGQLR